MPDVSVVVPTYNRLPLLRQTMPSLLAQTEPKLEIIVADGGSTDGTQGYVQRLDDQRIRLITLDKPVPHFENWSRGIKAARGKYIALYHDDDIYDASMVARSRAFLDDHPTVGFVHVAARVLSQLNQFHGLRQAAPHDFVRHGQDEALRWICHIHDVVPSSTMVRREIYEQAGLFEPKLFFADFDLYVRIALITDIGFIADPLLWLRQHEQSVTNNMRPHRFVEEIELLLPRFRNHFQAAGVEPPQGWPVISRQLRGSMARHLRRLYLSLVRRGDHDVATRVGQAILTLDHGVYSRAFVAALSGLNRPVVTALLRLLYSLNRQKKYALSRTTT